MTGVRPALAPARHERRVDDELVGTFRLPRISAIDRTFSVVASFSAPMISVGRSIFAAASSRIVCTTGRLAQLSAPGAPWQTSISLCVPRASYASRSSGRSATAPSPSTWILCRFRVVWPPRAPAQAAHRWKLASLAALRFAQGPTRYAGVLAPAAALRPTVIPPPPDDPPEDDLEPAPAPSGAAASVLPRHRASATIQRAS